MSYEQYKVRNSSLHPGSSPYRPTYSSKHPTGPHILPSTLQAHIFSQAPYRPTYSSKHPTGPHILPSTLSPKQNYNSETPPHFSLHALFCPNDNSSTVAAQLCLQKPHFSLCQYPNSSLTPNNATHSKCPVSSLTVNYFAVIRKMITQRIAVLGPLPVR